MHSRNWPDRFFARLVDGFLHRSGNRGGRVGEAETYILSARELIEFSRPVMEAVAHDASAADRLLPSGEPL